MGKYMKKRHNNYFKAAVATLLACTLSSALASAQKREFTSDVAYQDFFYAGAAIQIRMYKVQHGQIAWDYNYEHGWGEISDAQLLDDGNVLVASMFNIFEVSKDGRMLWQYVVRPGHEIHTIQPIGNHYVVFIENGKPNGKVVVMEIPLKKRVREFDIPIRPGSGIHGQFRSCRLTPHGTLLVANTTMNKITEYDSKGNVLNDWDATSPWMALEIDNGNIIYTSNRGFVREFNKKGDVVWEINMRKDIPQFRMTSLQRFWRKKNGNTIINNWYNSWNNRQFELFNLVSPPVQAIEVTPENKVVWVLRSWAYPVNLGPSTTVQPLDEPYVRSKCYFGEFK